MFNTKEIILLASLGLYIDVKNISDEEWIRLEDEVSTKLMTDGINDDGLTPIGKICESILDKIP